MPAHGGALAFSFHPYQTMLKESCFKIGFIQRTHGLKGEVTSIIEGNLPEVELTTVFIEENNRLIPYFIKSFSLQGTKALIRFEDVDQLEHAKKLVGKAVYLPKTLRPRLGRGKFYDDEIIGFIVTDAELGNLGPVLEIVEAGPNKLIAVDHAGKEILIPVNGPFIKSVNKSKQSVMVELPDGFLDL